MAKAFLSYSSDDSAFVEAVASRLGRARIAFDKMYFRPGVDFREAIAAGIKDSELFVIFVSQKSLASTWVRHELSEAQLASIAGGLRGSIAIIIDRTTKPVDLPRWLQQGRIVQCSSEAEARRIVEARLFAPSDSTHETLFVGREDLLKRFRSKLVGSAHSAPPRILIIHGLQGVGRRTFVRRALQDFVGLELGPYLALDEGEGLDKLHLLLLEETSDHIDRVSLARELSLFQSMDIEARGKELARLIGLAAHNNFACCIVDQGALLDGTGAYSPEALQVFASVAEHPWLYLVVVQRRQPAQRAIPIEVPVVVQSVGPLQDNATAFLLGQYLNRQEIAFNSAQLGTLSRHLAGYPPAVSWAVELVDSYGVETIVADETILDDLTIQVFAPVLQRLHLSSVEWYLLRMMASSLALPLHAMARILNVDQADLARELVRLVDLNLLSRTGSYLEIAPPIREAVIRLQGALSKSEHAEIARQLIANYWKDNEGLPDLRIVDATILSLLKSDSKNLHEFADLTLPSTMYRAARAAYDTTPKDLERAEELSARILAMDPDHNGARSLHCRCLIRQQKWSQVDIALEEIQARRLRDHLYLTGLYHWKHGDLSSAVRDYRSALRSGDRSVQVYRDLAHCLLRLNRGREADRVVREAFEVRNGAYKNNRFLLDVECQIATEIGDYTRAERILDQLHLVDAAESYHHRLSVLLSKRGDIQAALRHAEEACTAKFPRFECLAHRVDMLIQSPDLRKARRLLGELKGQDDVVNGLYCKLTLAENDWRAAESYWDKIGNKGLAVHKALRARILRQRLDSNETSLGEREDIEKELRSLGEAADSSLVIGISDEDDD